MNIPNSEDVLKNLFKDFAIENKDLELIKSKLKFLKLKKGDFFLKEGTTCNKLGILLGGLLYASFGEEKEHVSRFFFLPENLIVTNFKSFKSQTVSNESIRAIEESYLFYFSFLDLNELYEKIPSMNVVGRELAEDSYIKAQERNHFLQVLNNQEKLKSFHRQLPDLYNRVSKNHLASYLGMHRNDISKYMKSVFAGNPATH